MADIILNKPEAGTQAVFEAAGDSRIDLNFPTDQATLERSGNDLIFRFDDGSTVVLRDFYTAYTKDSMPDFVIEGTPIAGEQFFTALNEPDLMPAAGPAANAASADGGRFREYADDALINGINRLDGLCRIHCCTMRSTMVGIPRGRVFPFGFGISTLRTGRG